MPAPKWSTKFQLKPGKWVFVPTNESIKVGKEIKKAVEGYWKKRPRYFYHLRAGGHVSALRAHVGNSTFVRLDITDFFGSINRSRITRCLVPVAGYKKARQWANASTVIAPDDSKRWIVPFGFVQSPILASLCLEESALGSCLRKLHADKRFAVSVYVDDLIVSSSDPQMLGEAVLSDLHRAAERAQFKLSAEKSQGPAPTIKAFNIELSNGSMRVDEERIKRFRAALEETDNTFARAGIVGYVTSVNADQGQEIAKPSGAKPPES